MQSIKNAITFCDSISLKIMPGFWKIMKIQLLVVSFIMMYRSFLAILSQISNKKLYKNLKGKVAIITGGTDGIGKELAINLKRRGIQVIITGRNQEKLEKTVEEINSNKKDEEKSVKGIKLDMNEDFSVAKLEEAFKEIDLKEVGILFNNAGVSSEYPMFLFEETRIDEIITVNNLNLVKLTQFMVKNFLESKSNTKKYIINTGSFTADLPCSFISVYGASKSFLKSFSRSLYHELGPLNIHTEYIDTGFVSTKMSRKRPSFMTPSSSDFAECILNTIGSLSVNAAYLPHSIIFMVAQFMPNFILGKLVYLTNSSVRIKAIKRNKKD